ncbi:cytochrome c biogenesis protein CcdA, partial [Salmonella enterica]|uniref:cytochrome c biogenesis protein CcdA n=1 Tax=Salmonella enterica TaxID=28901 RepID=UPI000B291A5E
YIRRQSLASDSGIVATFMGLAGFINLLRRSDLALAWGVEFQNAWFIDFMALVMLLFSASLFGLFEFGLPSSMTTKLATYGGNALSGLFWNGAFATLLATLSIVPFLVPPAPLQLTASLPTPWGRCLSLG